jgi:Cdc6-like AAA superfamily ATPase
MKSRNEDKKNHTIIDWINSVSTKPKSASNHSKKIEQPDFIINSNFNTIIPLSRGLRNIDQTILKILYSRTSIAFFSKHYRKEPFPHLLLYGPPGIGKTTAAISLINEYQQKIQPNQ